MTRAGLADRGIPRAPAALVMLAAAAGGAHADQPRERPSAVEIDRDGAPAGQLGFGFDAGEPVEAWGVSLAASWLERPIELPAGTLGPGTPASRPVRRRQTLALGGALALGDSAVLDVRLRASHQVGARLAAAGDTERLARYVLHDLRVGGRLRVVGDAARAALVRVELMFPTGNDEQFAGDVRWTAAWSLIGRVRFPYGGVSGSSDSGSSDSGSSDSGSSDSGSSDSGSSDSGADVGRSSRGGNAPGVTLAAAAGVRLHGAEVAVGDRLIGDELFGALGARAALPGALAPVSLTAELVGALGDDVGGRSAPSPLEARLGAIVDLGAGLAIGIGGGAGLVEQIGAPRFRGWFAAAWTPRADSDTSR